MTRSPLRCCTNFIYSNYRENHRNFCEKARIPANSFTSRSREDESRNGRRNAQRNPHQNQESIVLGVFSFENLKRDLEQQFLDSDLDFVLHSDDHFESHLLGNGLLVPGKDAAL